MASRTPLVLLASLLGHGALVGGLLLLSGARRPSAEAIPSPGRFGALVCPRARAATSPVTLLEARRKLVEDARASLRAGALALGEFILQANALDAEERRRPIDLAGARALYRARLEALRTKLRDEPLRRAVPEVFEDIRYYGRPGGLMADALVDKGGSCEQVSHLVAAAAYDAGRQAEIALRFYGEGSSGATHLAAIALSAPAKGAGTKEPDESDLLSGRAALRTGIRFPASDLVEAYARAHGLAPPLASAVGRAPPDPPGGGDGCDGADAPSMTAGYPPNRDRYPGALPMYAARAVEDLADPDETNESRADSTPARDCAYFLRMAVLSPPSIEALPGLQVEPRRVPGSSELSRRAALLSTAEDLSRSEDPADRLMGLACVAAMGDRAAVDFTLAGERRLAAEAEEKSRRASEAGRAMIERTSWSGGEWAGLRVRLSAEYAGRTWLLLALPGGDRMVMDIVKEAREEDWGQVNALAGLVVYPFTRPRALSMLATMSRREQVDVMHEVFHAHDDLRPWAPNFRLDEQGAGPPDAEFVRAYRVFRGLAWRLWEGQRPVPEVLAALSVETRAARLDEAWSAVFIEYYGRSVLGLAQMRAGGMSVVHALRDAVADRREPELELLRRRLDYIESRERLDPETLSDAWRLR